MSPAFKGGTSIHKKGYIKVTAGPQRDRLVHDLCMECKLGRALLPTEDVHHIDGNRLNLAFDNLELIDHTAHGHVSAAQGQYLKRKEAKLKEEWDEHFKETDHGTEDSSREDQAAG